MAEASTSRTSPLGANPYYIHIIQIIAPGLSPSMDSHGLIAPGRQAMQSNGKTYGTGTNSLRTSPL